MSNLQNKYFRIRKLNEEIVNRKQRIFQCTVQEQKVYINQSQEVETNEDQSLKKELNYHYMTLLLCQLMLAGRGGCSIVNLHKNAGTKKKTCPTSSILFADIKIFLQHSFKRYQVVIFLYLVLTTQYHRLR